MTSATRLTEDGSYKIDQFSVTNLLSLWRQLLNYGSFSNITLIRVKYILQEACSIKINDVSYTNTSTLSIHDVFCSGVVYEN